MSPLEAEGGTPVASGSQSSTTTAPSATPSATPGSQGGIGGQPPAPAKPPTTAQKLWDDALVKPAPAKEPAAAPAAAAPVVPDNVVSLQQPPAATPVGVTADQIADIVQRTATAMRPVEAPKGPTQEEFEAAFNIYKPSADVLAALRSDDPAVAMQGIQHIVQGAVKQATTVASHQIAFELDKLRQSFAPALSMAQERNLEAMKTEFFTQNQDLVGLDSLLVQIKDSFVQQKKSFGTKEEAFKAVAAEARRVLASIPGYKAGVPAQPGNAAVQQTGTQGKMPALSGGQGATGVGGGSAPPAKNTAQRIFE